MSKTNIDFAKTISLNEVAKLIRNVGPKATVMVEGHMGSGKSALLKILAKLLPGFETAYFDMTNLDLGDLMLPAVQHDRRETEFYPNALFKIHSKKPVIYMFDELGKASRPVQNACLPILLERRVGAQWLHPDSIVFATTNLGAEGVGDTLQPHSRNRMVLVNMRKPTADEWIENFAVDAGIVPEVVAWVRETPQVMQGFDEVQKADDNPYIFHPQVQRVAFVTPRSLEKASDVLKIRGELAEDTLIHALAGTVGMRAALDLRAFVHLADKLPGWKEVIGAPESCNVPKEAAAIIMLVFTALARVEKDTVTPWVKYMNRIPKEAQALFCHHAMKATRTATICSMNKDFTSYAMKNQYLY